MMIKFGCVAALLALVACGGNSADTKTPASKDSTTTSSTASSNSTAPTGGEQLGDLETKRMQDNIKNDLPKHKAKFKEMCGTDVDIDIDWASFGHDKKSLETMWSNYGAERLVAGFEKPCKDQAGKDAVKAKVKKIRAINITDAAKAKATLSGGTLTVELAWATGTPGMNENDLGAAITKAL